MVCCSSGPSFARAAVWTKTIRRCRSPIFLSIRSRWSRTGVGNAPIAAPRSARASAVLLPIQSCMDMPMCFAWHQSKCEFTRRRVMDPLLSFASWLMSCHMSAFAHVSFGLPCWMSSQPSTKALQSGTTTASPMVSLRMNRRAHRPALTCVCGKPGTTANHPPTKALCSLRIETPTLFAEGGGQMT